MRFIGTGYRFKRRFSIASVHPSSHFCAIAAAAGNSGTRTIFRRVEELERLDKYNACIFAFVSINSVHL